ncbi:MAG: FtsX-like permease family protein [Campylobacteraceae bacterium]|jgi:putative ABC transport system permease protein|nr:FtsX-like permease family protein [Campylobacteraceae bacterium]
MMGVIWSDFKRMWAGSLMMVLLIASIISFGLFITLEERALREGSARAADRFDLLIGAAGSETQLVLSLVYLQKSPLPLLDGKYYDEIQNSELVSWAAPVAFGDYYRDMSVIGTTEILITDNDRLKLTKGRLFKEPYEAVAGANSGLNVGDKFTPLHGDTHSHDEVRYEVVGIAPLYDDAWDRAIFVPIESVWRIHGLTHDEHGAHGDDEHEEHADEDNGHSVHDEHEHAAHAADKYYKHTDDEHEAHEDDERSAHNEHEERKVHADDEHDEHATHDNHEHTDDEHAAHEDEATPPISAIIVKPKSISAAYKLREMYRKDLTQALFPAEVLSRLYAILGDVEKILSDIAFGAKILGSIVIVIISTIYSKLRQRQIAVLRAFGASVHRIFFAMWFGFMILVSFGFAFGIGFGFYAAKLAAEKISLEQGFGLLVRLEWGDFGAMGLFLLFLSVVLLIPCAFSYKSPALKCLRES